MPKPYYLEEREAFQTKYLKVFLQDAKLIDKVSAYLEKLPSVHKANITKTDTSANITVYPEKMYDLRETKEDVTKALNAYSSGIITQEKHPETKAHFNDIQSKILDELDGAKAQIYVDMAWFTNDKLRDKLLEKKNEGVDVKVIIQDDGTNRTHGVDLTDIPHKLVKGERGGIMHKKYCIIDNNDVITGSYNWSNNAEFRNEENIQIVKNDTPNASEFTKDFNRRWNS